MDSLEKQLGLMGQIASQGVSIPEFLRKPIATCLFVCLLDLTLYVPSTTFQL